MEMVSTITNLISNVVTFAGGLLLLFGAVTLGTGGSITEPAWAMLGQSVILLVAVFMSGKFTKAITNAMT